MRKAEDYVEFAESKIAALAVEFFDWCMINDKVVCGFSGTAHTNDIDSKDLFQEFLKQRNNE